MSIVFDYPLYIPHKYTCSNNGLSCADAPFCEGQYYDSTVAKIAVVPLRAILLFEIAICCIKTNQNYTEVKLCLVILQ